MQGSGIWDQYTRNKLGRSAQTLKRCQTLKEGIHSASECTNTIKYHKQNKTLCQSGSSAASDRLTGYSQIDFLGWRYKSVNIRTKKSPVSPTFPNPINGDRDRKGGGQEMPPHLIKVENDWVNLIKFENDLLDCVELGAHVLHFPEPRMLRIHLSIHHSPQLMKHRLRVEGWGFGVEGLRFRAYLGLKVGGLGPRLSRLGLRVSGLGFRV